MTVHRLLVFIFHILYIFMQFYTVSYYQTFSLCNVASVSGIKMLSPLIRSQDNAHIAESGDGRTLLTMWLLMAAG